MHGDTLLLSAAHLLTAIGFAVLLSRPDPLRDGLLFVRFAETVAVGLALMAGALARQLCRRRIGDAQLSSARCRSVALDTVDSVRHRAGLQLRAGQSRAGAADRSDSPAACAVPGRILRPPVGVAPGSSRPVDSRRCGCPSGSTCRAASTSCRSSSASGRRSCSSSFRRISGRRCFSVASSSPSTRVARGRIGMAAAGLALLVAGFYVGYRLQISADARRPRPDVAVAVGQRRRAAATRSRTRCGRWRRAAAFGTGLGLGDSRYLPAGHTDLVLAAIGEELGVVGLVVVAALFAVLAWRGFRIARRRRERLRVLSRDGADAVS